MQRKQITGLSLEIDSEPKFKIKGIVQYSVAKSFFWTDSMSTLRYINNTKSRFKTFVANRLAIIHEVTGPSDWFYISTKENPADLASRGVSPGYKKLLDRWLKGPKFLQDMSCGYPEQSRKAKDKDDNDLEVKTMFAVEVYDENEDNFKPMV